MLLNHFIDYLKSNAVDSVHDTLTASHQIVISDIICTVDKEFKFNSFQSVSFERCTFKNLKVSHTIKINFVDCKIEQFSALVGNFVFTNLEAESIIIENEAKAIIQLCNVPIKSFTVSKLSGGASLMLMNVQVTKMLIKNKFINSSITFGGVTVDELIFSNCKVAETAKLLFHSLTVTEKLKFQNSILDFTEFHSCNFRTAIHIISESRYDNALFIDIEWFKKIYTTHIRSKKKFFDRFLNRKFISNLKKIKLFGIGHYFEYYRRREFYEAYREYKLIMSRVKNRADEIYFKSKEYNAKYFQLSFLSRNFSDKLILFFNRYSNNHGRFWLLPIFWIFFIGAFFFYGFISNSSIACTEGTGFNLVTDNFAQYLMFLNPTHDIYYLDGNRTVYLQDKAVVYDWSFRIINAYLIFQTISSFRRYKE